MIFNNFEIHRALMFTSEESIPANARVNIVICYQKCKQGFIMNSVEEGNKLSMHTQQELALKEIFLHT